MVYPKGKQKFEHLKEGVYESELAKGETPEVAEHIAYATAVKEGYYIPKHHPIKMAYYHAREK